MEMKLFHRVFLQLVTCSAKNVFIKKYFFYSLMLIVLGGCGDSSQILPSVKDFELEFSRYKGDPDKEQILDLSDQVYSGSIACFLSAKCLKVCNYIYSIEEDQNDCKQRKTQQVFQWEQLYNTLQKKNPADLQDINVFDLKVFFNVSAEPLFQLFKSLDLFSSKIVFNWIALNWQVAKVFREEDDQFLFLRIFLNKLANSPINSLKESILGERTFMELAWLKQNDYALLWINDYFQNSQCSGEQELDRCVLGQYCSASGSFNQDVSREIVKFQSIADLLKKEGGSKDFKSFCSDFCSSASAGQAYCS